MGKVLQINLNPDIVARDLLLQLVRVEKADIVIMSEQYRNLSKPTWVRDCTSTGHLGMRITSHIQNKWTSLYPVTSG